MIVNPAANQENSKTSKADDTAERECRIFVGECYCVCTLGEVEAYHSITNQNGLDRVTVYRCMPVSILRDRGIKDTITITVDRTFDVCVFKGSQFQSRGIEDIITLGKYFIIQNSGTQINSTGLIGRAAKADLELITRHHIANA